MIAILAAMLMPALQSARERGRASNCTNNFKQMGLAFFTYTETYGDYMTPATLPQMCGSNNMLWDMALVEYVKIPYTMFFCPSHTEQQPDPFRTATQKVPIFSAYGIPNYSGGTVGYTYKSGGAKMVNVKAPSKLYTAMDVRLGSELTIDKGYYCLKEGYAWGRTDNGLPSPRHNGGRIVNALLWDGHVGSFSSKWGADIDPYAEEIGDYLKYPERWYMHGVRSKN